MAHALSQDTPPAPAESPAEPRCANCGGTVPGSFCGECGQRNVPRLISVRRMLWDALDDQLTVNSALPRTLRGLLLRPGFLTVEYAAGRVVRYVAPFRLYLATSLGFFLALALIADPVRLGRQVESEILRNEAAEAPAVQKPAPRGKFIHLGLWRDTAAVPGWAKPIAHRLALQEDRINAMSKGQAVSALVDGMERNAPKAIFLLLPVFALFLKLLYIRRKRFYVEHFVFALHVHAFAFLVFTVILSTRSPHLSAALLLWLLAYPFLAMRRVYGQGVVQTGVKYVVLSCAYFFTVMAGLLATMLITTLTV